MYMYDLCTGVNKLNELYLTYHLICMYQYLRHYHSVDPTNLAYPFVLCNTAWNIFQWLNPVVIYSNAYLYKSLSVNLSSAKCQHIPVNNKGSKTIFNFSQDHNAPCLHHCIAIVFDFPWGCNTQEKLETMVMQNFVG